MIFNTRTFENSTFFAHFHKSFELIYVVKGELCCTIDGNNYTFSEGQFALIFPYQIHSWEIGDGRIYICVFSEGYVKSFLKSAAGHRAENPVFTVSEAVERYFLDTLYTDFPEYFNKPAPENSLEIKSALYGICHDFLKSVKLIKTQESPSGQLIIEMLKYISEHFKEDISLRTIATATGYNYQHISKVFNQKINMSFKAFLNWHRFEYAKELLAESKKSITEIAHESGFQSIRNFNCVCMQLSGKTPRELR